VRDPFERRLPLAHRPTPVEPLSRLGAELGMAPGALLVKRDDVTGLAGGGNKARKLEFLCADALDRGCDTLVTGGGRQSNHVRMTAAAANRLGMQCTIVLSSPPPERPSGNVLLDHVLGPDIEWAGVLDFDALEEAIGAACDRLAAAGRRPYRVPIGGASAVGALGYVDAARELVGQVGSVEVVVTADGSGGTHAGLSAGLGDHGRVLGVDVGARPDIVDAVRVMAVEAAALAGLAAGGPAGEVRIDRGQVGDGYGAATDECRDAIRLAARLEGLILDPVYTGKAMAGLIAARRSGEIADEETVVFLHTGGMPALFAARYADWLTAP
jgi:D-cysteine desulfhydrase